VTPSFILGRRPSPPFFLIWMLSLPFGPRQMTALLRSGRTHTISPSFLFWYKVGHNFIFAGSLHPSFPPSPPLPSSALKVEMEQGQVPDSPSTGMPLVARYLFSLLLAGKITGGIWNFCFLRAGVRRTVHFLGLSFHGYQV